MPWSAEEYDQAKTLSTDPSLDAGRRNALNERIKAYEQDQAMALGRNPEAAGIATAVGKKLKRKAAAQRATNPQLGEMRWMGAKEGLESLQGNEIFTAGTENDFEPAGFRRVRRPGGKYEYTDRATRNGVDIRPKLTPSATRGDEQLDVSQWHAEEQSSLPQASGNPQLYRPPELIPSHVDAATAMKARVEFEPTLDQFRADMSHALGPSIMEMTEDSPEYKLYADSLWARKYDAAAKLGVPITRQQYKNSDSWLDKVGDFSVNARDTLEAGLTGLGSGLTIGAAPEAAGVVAEKLGQKDALEGYREQQRRHPIAAFTGNLLGALNPASAVAKLGALGNAAMPAAKTGLGAVARAATLGGGLGGTTGLIEASNRQFANAAVSPDAGQYLSHVQPEDILKPAAIGAATGGALGAAGELLGQGASSAVKALRRGRHAEDLAIAERGGAMTSAVGQVKLPPGVQGNIDEALRSDIGGDAVDRAIDKVKGPMADTAYAQSRRIIQQLGSENEAYNASPEGRAQHPLKNLALRLRDLVERKTKDGRDLPMVKSAPFKRALEKAVDPVVVSKHEALGLIAREGGWLVSEEDAARMGWTPRPLSSDEIGQLPRLPSSPLTMAPNDAVTALEGKGPVASDARVIVVRPLKVNAQKLQEIIGDIDEAADVSAGASASKRSSRAYRDLMDAVRQDSQQWQGNSITGTKSMKLPNGQTVKGFAAMKARHAEELQRLKQLNKRAGLPESPQGGWDKLSATERAAFEGSLRKTGKPGLSSEKARQVLAENAGLLDELKQIGTTRVGRELQLGREGPARGFNTSFLRTLLGELAPGSSLRMDPAMRSMAMSTDELSPQLRSLLERMRVAPKAQSRDAIRQSLGLRSQYAQLPGELPLELQLGRLRIGRPQGGSIGLRHGGIGAKAGQVSASTPAARRKLSAEDERNLLLLIRSAQGEQQ